MRTVTAVLAVAWLAACATSGRSGRIRQLDEEVPPSCRVIGVVESAERTGWDMRDDQLGPVNAIRRRVAAMGGNAFRLQHGAGPGYGSATRAEVYRCP